MRNPVQDLRIIGFAEGISYLLLLFVAMPLKYAAGLPLAVRIVGTLHGVLFILYVVAALRAACSRKWPFLRLLEALIASLYPFGTFVFDRKLRAELSGMP